MFFVIFGLAGFLLALVRRVSLTELANRQFLSIWALWLSFGLHVALGPFVLPPDIARSFVTSPLPFLPSIGGMLYLLSLVVALIFLVHNQHLPGFRLMIIGFILNFIVIAANGGQMPGDPVQLARAGLLEGSLEDLANGLWSPFKLMDANTSLPHLADVIFVPLPFRDPVVSSLGDFSIGLGEILFFNPIAWLAALDERLRALIARLFGLSPRELSDTV